MNFHRTMVEAMNESGFSQKNGKRGKEKITMLVPNRE